MAERHFSRSYEQRAVAEASQRDNISISNNYLVYPLSAAY